MEFEHLTSDLTQHCTVLASVLLYCGHHRILHGWCADESTHDAVTNLVYWLARTSTTVFALKGREIFKTPEVHEWYSIVRVQYDRLKQERERVVTEACSKTAHLVVIRKF